VAQNISTRVEEGAIVMESNDEAQLKEMIDRISKVNDDLMEYIDNS
jgi:hypothetical protein